MGEEIKFINRVHKQKLEDNDYCSNKSCTFV